jgi:ABC-type polysaccharide/polyol phosphate export permease
MMMRRVTLLPATLSKWLTSRPLNFWLILAILIVAAILRLHHITQPFTDVFSWRQTSTAMMAENFYRKDWNIFYPEVNWTGPGPSYQGRELQTVSYIAALIYILLGQHDWIGRSVAVLFGLWGIFAFYQLIRRVWDEKYALVSAAVMAVMPGSIFIERSFLPDPAMVALVITSFWLWISYLQTEKRRYLFLASLIGAWGFCTKIPGLVVGLPIIYATLAIVGFHRIRQRKALIALASFGVLSLTPVVIYYLWARHLSLSYPPYHFAGSGNWLWNDGLKSWWNQNYFLPDLEKNLYYWLWSAPVIYLVALGLLFGALRVVGSRETANDQQHISNPVKAPWLFHWWFVAGVIYYLIGAKELTDNPWNFHIINPAAAALAGYAIVSIAAYLGRFSRWAGSTQISLLKVLGQSQVLITLAFLFVISLLGQSLLRSMYYRSYGNESYELGLALQQVSHPGDLVVTMASDLGDPNAIYYSQRRGWIFPPASNDIDWSQLPADDDISIQMFEELRAEGAKWLGIANERTKDFWSEHPKLVEHIKRTSELQLESPSYVIYRILNTAEIGHLAALPLQLPVGFIDIPLVTQEIRYHMSQADEIFLVWGINGWAIVPEIVRPEGTVLKEGVMRTPMIRQGDTFVAKIQVPSGTTIDYGFLITKGNNGVIGKPIWEANGKEDYHTSVTQNNMIEVETRLTLTEDSTFAGVPLLRQPLLLVFGLILGLGALLVARKKLIRTGLKSLPFGPRPIYLRDLLRELVARDLKLRYKRSILGIAWSLLNPLAQLLIFVFLFHKVFPLNIPNYPLFVFSGVLAWTWFQSSLFLATGAITDNRELIRRPGFPAAILPVVIVMSSLIHFLLALPILLLFVLIAGIHLTSAILMLLVVIALQFLLTLSLAYLVATFHVTFRDTQHLLGVLLLLLFYLTPVFYTASAVPEPYQWLYFLNPMAHLIGAYRTILIQGEPPGYLMLLSLGVVSAGLLGLGYTVFMRASYRFVEEL